MSFLTEINSITILDAIKSEKQKKSIEKENSKNYFAFVLKIS